jgi:hypothetical protein
MINFDSKEPYVTPLCKTRSIAVESSICSPMDPPIGGGEGGGEEPIGDE